ncbi:hypothetical protein QUF72_05295 [Desulfobacterales bacterium HSG2]|nr:hypothetical protein [Desulfobacterales bacterium HSG2]
MQHWFFWLTQSPLRWRMAVPVRRNIADGIANPVRHGSDCKI